ncbi:MAG TPA: acyl-CoA dehydrogenase [Hellea balneolensis]|uniref:Acyl-CoA dehydrogenase n=1 Tax=Hellea balneolensis TaxID=287478 RepID=A0A7C5QWD5_9PROT|nr:acyl-CoA dehydrogenase [Hellea balneolensis]
MGYDLGIKRPSWRDEEEFVLFADAANAFVADTCVPHIEKWEKQGVVDREVWMKGGEYGLLVPDCPVEYGGAGGDFRHDAVLIDAVHGQGVDSWGVVLHNAIVAPYITAFASEDQKKEWMPKLISGEYVAAIAMTEPGAGSDLQGMKTTALKQGNHYVINGSKTFITNGGTANFIIVCAKTDPSEGAKGISLFAVETDGLAGFRRGRKLDKVGLKGQDTAELFFDDMKVPASALIGPEEGKGFYQLMDKLPQERLIIALQAMAMIENILGQTIDYVRERKAFGKSIMDFQNTRFKLAECKSQAAMAKVFCDYCTDELVAGRLTTEMASMAKYLLSDLQCKIVDECVQLHGGYGYMNEYPVARAWRDARVQRIYGGTNEIMKLVIARGL